MKTLLMLALLLAAGIGPAAQAEEAKTFHCEVLALEGRASAVGSDGASVVLKVGDLLSAGDTLSVGDDSYVDIAYDKEWKNVTRFEANSRAKISSVAPPKISLEMGTVFAKLKSVPRNSAFEVKTPTAVATVRGTEYRTRYENGQTDVFNDSPSQVFVYGVTEDGSPDPDTLQVLERDRKTNIASLGDKPAQPKVMTEDESIEGGRLSSQVQKAIEQVVKEGRVSTIQSVQEIESFIESRSKKTAPLAAANDSELSRVTDTRRRPFGGNRAMAPPEPPQETPQAEVPSEGAAPPDEAVDAAG